MQARFSVRSLIDPHVIFTALNQHVPMEIEIVLDGQPVRVLATIDGFRFEGQRGEFSGVLDSGRPFTCVMLPDGAYMTIVLPAGIDWWNSEPSVPVAA